MRRLSVLSALLLVLLLGVTGCGLSSCSRGGNMGGTGTGGGATLALAVGEPAEFSFGGETHTVELISVAGSSVELVLSSSPQTLYVTEWQPQTADLNNDSVNEATVAVSDVGKDKAKVTIAGITTPSYDETSFETTGGLAPYNVSSFYEVDPSVVVLDDGSFVLFYNSADTTYVQWEHYNPDGMQVTSPRLGAGRFDAVGGRQLGEYLDAVRAGGTTYIVAEATRGTYIGGFSLETASGGGGGLLTPWERNAALATDGTRVWMATAEAAKQYSQTGGTRPAVAVMTIAAGNTPGRMGTAKVTEPPDKVQDVAPDIAYDATTDLLAVPYERFYTSTNKYEVRLVVVDPKTLKAVHDVQIADPEKRTGGGGSGVTAIAENGAALVFWETGGNLNQHITTVDLKTGSVKNTFEGTNDTGIPGLTMNNWDVELIGLKTGPALLYLDRFASENDNATDDERHRFTLQPITAAGPTGKPIVLNGGQPVLADVTFDLASLHANPVKAVCGAPCLLMGTVVNRGSRQASKVMLDVAVDGKAVGTLDLGTIKPGAGTTFAKVWEVPADLTAEQVEVTYKLSTTAKQYTLDNDTAITTVLVRQKGLVQGRVSDASAGYGLNWWTRGIEGVRVTYGDRVALTDNQGWFAFEEVEFGPGTLSATKEGYNPASLEVTTSRTRPIASAGIAMDDHGTLRFDVVDEGGVPLAGVDAYLLGYDRMDTTDDSGKLEYSISKGVYRFAFVKRGYHAVPPTEYTVALGQDKTETITMREAKTAKLSGRVVDKQGSGVAGATVTIKDPKGAIVASPAVTGEGDFAQVELSTKPSGAYTIVASGNGLTVEEPISLVGGDVASVMVELIPGRGTLRGRAATEGYTAWMIKAAGAGFMGVGGEAVYTWFGNHAIRVGTQYWDKSRELSEIDITTWGGTYETYVVKGEIEFEVSGDDLVGSGAKKKLPSAMAEKTDAPSSSWWKTAAMTGYTFYKDYADPITLTKEILKGASELKEAWSGEGEDWIILGQGPELLTWKQALEDFNVRPSWDSDDIVGSISSYKDAIPTSFAIPILIGGSSVQETAVRVDGVDVVDKETGEVYLTDRSTPWYSYDGTETDNSNYRRFEIARADVPADDCRVMVWITTQKYWHGAPGGTCYSQREQEVVIFDVGGGGMKCFIAPGDMYKDPSRWTTAEIERLTGD